MKLISSLFLSGVLLFSFSAYAGGGGGGSALERERGSASEYVFSKQSGDMYLISFTNTSRSGKVPKSHYLIRYSICQNIGKGADACSKGTFGPNEIATYYTGGVKAKVSHDVEWVK